MVIGLSFLQINSLETTNYNANYKSGWIQTNGNKYLEIYIKDNGSTAVSQSMYNLTFIIKRTDGAGIQQYNQTLIAFSTYATQFMIEFQSNYPLTVSYSIYLFKASQFDVTATASNHVQEVTLLQSGSTASLSIIPLLVALPVIYGLKKYYKKKILLK